MLHTFKVASVVISREKHTPKGTKYKTHISHLVPVYWKPKGCASHSFLFLSLLYIFTDVPIKKCPELFISNKSVY